MNALAGLACALLLSSCGRVEESRRGTHSETTLGAGRLRRDQQFTITAPKTTPDTITAGLAMWAPRGTKISGRGTLILPDGLDVWVLLCKPSGSIGKIDFRSILRFQHSGSREVFAAGNFSGVF